MLELSTAAKMIIASNLTIAATIRDAAMAMKSGPQPVDSIDLVKNLYSEILAHLDKPGEIT
jgi:hypothetical protein